MFRHVSHLLLGTPTNYGSSIDEKITEQQDLSKTISDIFGSLKTLATAIEQNKDSALANLSNISNEFTSSATPGSIIEGWSGSFGRAASVIRQRIARLDSSMIGNYSQGEEDKVSRIRKNQVYPRNQIKIVRYNPQKSIQSTENIYVCEKTQQAQKTNEVSNQKPRFRAFNELPPRPQSAKTTTPPRSRVSLKDKIRNAESIHEKLQSGAQKSLVRKSTSTSK